MTKSPSNDPRDPLPEDDPLWDLLGNAPEPRPRPGFARRVLRAVPSRHRADSRKAGLFRLPLAAAARTLRGGRSRITSRSKSFAAAGACALLLLAGGLLFSLRPGAEHSAPLAENGTALPGETGTLFDPASEFEEVSQFAALVTVEDPGTLSDEELGDLFTSL